jgi:hypothetical protein
VGIWLREARQLTLLADKQSTDLWDRWVIDYVVNRQNEDGGYTFPLAICIPQPIC